MDKSGNSDLLIPHGSVSGENVNLWSAFTSDRGYCTGANSYSLKLLRSRNNAKTDETARIHYYYDPSTNFLPNIDDGFFQPDHSFPLVTYRENMLIIAETQAKLGNKKKALDALNKVRQYNENTYGGIYEDLELKDFQPGGLYENTTILREIYDEAYLAYIGRIKGFNLVRRVNYPLDPTKASAETIPQRFLYSAQEINANPNVPDPIPGLFTATPINKD